MTPARRVALSWVTTAVEINGLEWSRVAEEMKRMAAGLCAKSSHCASDSQNVKILGAKSS